MENIIIRLATEDDYRQTETIIREAFWDVYKPGCEEHLVLHNLRKTTAFVEELDFVACDTDDNNKIVGNIVYSEAEIINNQNEEFTVLCMGPVGVLPSYQGKGIGSSLIEKSLSKARSLGYKGVILFGDPEYYHQFGFKNAKEYSIKTAEGDNFDAFMALELYDNSLNEIEGKFHANPVFETEQDELESFEEQFPYKEKHVTDTQLK